MGDLGSIITNAGKRGKGEQIDGGLKLTLVEMNLPSYIQPCCGMQAVKADSSVVQSTRGTCKGAL